MSQYPVDELPLTGRDAELRTIRAGLTGPRAHGVLIAGAVGVGKTRLAQEAGAFLEGKGWHLLPARTSGSGTGLPLAALAGLLLSEVPAPPGEPLVPSLDPLQRALLSLRTLAARSRSILVVDDAHLLDEQPCAASSPEAATQMIVYRVAVQVRQARLDRARLLFGDLVRASRAVPGVISFDILQDPDNATRFVSIEVYGNQAALDRQAVLPELDTVMAHLDDLLADGPEGTRFQVFAAEPWPTA